MRVVGLLVLLAVAVWSEDIVSVQDVEDEASEIDVEERDHSSEETPDCCDTVRDLVSGWRGVHNNDIRASSSYGRNYGPSRARLGTKENRNSGGAWIPSKNDKRPWIQVKFRETETILGIQTQGRNGEYNQYVRTFNVMYSYNGRDWRYVTSRSRHAQVFQGNGDKEAVMTNSWYLNGQSPLRARYIRILPLKWRGHAALRFGVLGCD